MNSKMDNITKSREKKFDDTHESDAFTNSLVTGPFLIIDDHEIVRHGLKFLLNEIYPAAVIDQANDGIGAVSYLKSKNYSLVVLDIRIPKTNTFELLDYIVTAHPQTRILVFSMCAELLYGKLIIHAGAHGYLSKEASIEEIKKAIEMISRNKRYISEQLLEILLNKPGKAEEANPFARLSSKEIVITSFLLSGCSISEIATHVNLQRSTVGTYKCRIFEKLKVANLIELKELAGLYNFY